MRRSPPDPERVVEVFAPAANDGGSYGSGYFVTRSLVLTVGHVVGVSADCEVRHLGAEEWTPARVVWRGVGCDAALLRASKEVGSWESVRFGRLASYQRAPCEGVGFPWAQAEPKTGVRDTEQIRGEIPPLTGIKGRLLNVDLAGQSVPLPLESGHSPWEGMSGAALFCGPLLVGIVSVAPEHFGTDRLQAESVAAMNDEATFAAAFEHVFELEAFEDLPARDVLRVPYEPLAARVSDSVLLRARHGVVPFRGRSEELSQLLEWCAGEANVTVALLLGAGGSGKTRLAAELCGTKERDGWLTGFLKDTATTEQLSGLADTTRPLLGGIGGTLKASSHASFSVARSAAYPDFGAVLPRSPEQ
jgi:hypothetical protein